MTERLQGRKRWIIWNPVFQLLCGILPVGIYALSGQHWSLVKKTNEISQYIPMSIIIKVFLIISVENSKTMMTFIFLRISFPDFDYMYFSGLRVYFYLHKNPNMFLPYLPSSNVLSATVVNNTIHDLPDPGVKIKLNISHHQVSNSVSQINSSQHFGSLINMPVHDMPFETHSRTLIQNVLKWHPTKDQHLWMYGLHQAAIV